MTALSGVADRVRTAKLAVRVDAGTDDLAALAEALFAGGVNLLHLDGAGAEPDREPAGLRAARASATAHQGLISTGPDVLVGEGFAPDVVQLAPADPPASSVRPRVHRWARIGRSVTEVAELGPVLADRDVDHLWVEGDLELVRTVAARVPPQESGSLPWFADAGADQQSLEDVLVAGARRVLVGAGLTGADDPRAAAQRIRARLNQAWRDDPAMAAGGLVLGGSPRPFRRG